MSTRYVWKKYTYTSKESQISYDYAGASISNASLSNVIFCSSLPTRNSDGTYSPSGNQQILSNLVNNSSGSFTHRLGITKAQYNYIVISGESFYYKCGYGTGTPYNNIEYMYTSSDTYDVNHDPIPSNYIYGYNIAQQLAVAGQARKYELVVSKVSLVETLSSGNSNAYSNGIFNEYFYEYQGSDSIDPVSFNYATSVDYKGPGNDTKLPYTITPSSSNTYGGTIEYNIEYKADGGNWNSSTSWQTNTTGSRSSFTANTYQFRVRARDNYGFTSATYVEGPVCTVIYNHSISVTASPTSGGSVSGGGTYASGNSVTVTASPNTGYAFSYWLEGSTQVSTNSSYTFTVSGDRTLTAVFTQTTTYYTVTVTASPTSGGSVGGSGSYASGTSVSVVAVANSGYNFSGWYEGNTLKSSSTSYTFTLTSNKTLQAKFTAQGSSGTGTGHDAFIGISNIAKKISNIYIGVDGIARKVVSGYIGVDNVARKFYETHKFSQQYVLANIPSLSTYTNIAFGNGVFCATSNGRSAISSDGENWKEVEDSGVLSHPWSDMCYFKDKFICVSSNYVSSNNYTGNIVYSFDGISWIDISSSSGMSNYGCKGIGASSNYAVVVFAGKYNYAKRSTNGTSWSNSNSTSYVNNLSRVAYSNGIFCAVRSTNETTCAQSTNNGYDWTKIDLNVSAYHSDIAGGNNSFVTICSYNPNSSLQTSTYFERRSATSTSWNTVSAPIASKWKAITYGGGIYMAIGNTPSVAAFSKDEGISWNLIELPNVTWNDVAYGNGKFVCVGSNGNVAIIY